MNKLLTKIVGVALGATMAIGVGVAVANSDRGVARADAATSTVTLNATNFGVSGTSYDSYTYTSGGFTFNADNCNLNNSQLNMRKSDGVVYNSTALTGKRIVSIAISNIGFSSSSSAGFYVYGGNTEKPVTTELLNNTGSTSNVTVSFSGYNYTYFQIKNKGTRTCRFSAVLTYEDVASSDYVGSLSVSPNTWTGYDSQTLSVASFTVSGSKNGTADSVTSADYDFKGIGYMSGDNFVARVADFSSGHPTTSDTRLAWKAKYPTTSGGSTYAWAYVTLTVTADSVSSIALSSNMTTTSYRSDATSWSEAGLVVTATYTSSNVSNVTASSTFNFYSDSAMTAEVTPATLGVGANQTIYVKATYSGVSNSTGYSQTVTVTQAPAEVVINHTDVASSGTNYATRNWTSGTITGTTLSAINSNGYFQFQKSSGANACFIANSDAIPGPITKIEITKKGSSAVTAFDAYFSTSQITSKPASGAVSQSASNSVWTWNVDENDEFTYFYIVNGADDTKYFDDVTITYKRVSLVDPTEITLDNSAAITMDTYGFGKRKLVATVEPYNANDKTVTWGTNNASVVTIADGVLTPVGVGSTTVYACTSNYDPEDPNPDLIKSVSVTVTQAEYKKATFTPTSGSTASQSDDYLTGGTVAVTGNWNSTAHAIQLTTNNTTATFTISGYEGMEITGIDLVMSSNGAAGTGSLTVTIGDTNVLEIETAPFSDSSWNGAYDANPVNLYKDSTDYVVASGEDIVFSFGATVNSLYVYSVSIRYLDYSLETWCQSFLDDLSCDSTGASAPSVSDWDDLGLAFLALDGDLQTIAKNATADENGTVIEKAMAKYDYVVGKYGDATYDDFIDRNPAPIGGAKIMLNSVIKQNSSIAAITIIISMITLTAVGGYFFMRKKKEQ